jgi:hypothetical protein
MIKIQLAESLSGNNTQPYLDLIRQTPVPGAISYHYERPVNYDAFAKTQGTNFQLWEARENDSLLGFTQITFDQVTWNNNPVTVSYSGDTRIAMAARGKKISDSLIQAACNQNVPVFGAVLGTNKIVLHKKLDDWDSLGIHFKEFAKLKAMLFRPAAFKSPKNAMGLFCRSAHESDIPAMYHLWKSYSETRNLPRYYDHLDRFANSYFQTPGVSLDQTFLVFDGISLIAMLSIWNQTKIRKLVVNEKNAWMKMASKLLYLPKVGEEIKILYSFQHAFLERNKLHSLALQTLVSKARNYSLMNKAHFFSLGLDAKDPVFPTIQKSALITNTARIILDPRENQDFSTSNLPLHLEVGMG